MLSPCMKALEYTVRKCLFHKPLQHISLSWTEVRLSNSMNQYVYYKKTQNYSLLFIAVADSMISNYTDHFFFHHYPQHHSHHRMSHWMQAFCVIKQSCISVQQSVKKAYLLCTTVVSAKLKKNKNKIHTTPLNSHFISNWNVQWLRH